jgi:SAM-dependent methyltransferase
VDGPFDEYISLGWNCEVAFQVRRVLGRDDASFFNWGIFEIDSLISLIEARFEGTFNADAIAWDADYQLPRDHNFDFAFHGPWGFELHDDPAFLIKLQAHQAKAAHLARRFLTPRGRRLYLYKPPYTMPTEKVERLAELLAEITPDATMAIFRLAHESSSNATHPMLRERVLQRAAPVDDASDGHLASWDTVFAEFPHRALGLRGPDPPPRVPALRASRSQGVNVSVTSLISTISPNDQMKGSSPSEEYFKAGSSALELCLDALKGRTPQVIVDFPSGHGRVLRWLRQRWPSASLHAVEIDDDALTFCQQTFDAEPIRSTPGFASLQLPQNADLIWSGSLLTHLNVDAWRSFLRLAVASLAPGGALVATTHGRIATMLAKRGDPIYGSLIDTKELAKIYATSGFAYDDYARAYPTYGLSFSSPKWLLGELQSIPDVKITYFRESGWGHQDAFALEKLNWTIDD